MDDRDTDRVQTVRRADSGKLEKLRRADRACRQDDFAPRPRVAALTVLAVAHPYGPAALEQDALDMRASDEAQVRPLENRLQERCRRAPASPAALVDFEIGRAFIVAAIEIIDFRNADLGARLARRVEDGP